MKYLVTYFSASGVTAGIAKAVAEGSGADSFEIRPEIPYSDADLRWMNPMACCNREKLGKKDVPVSGRVENMNEYDVIFIGFPIWYGCAPNVVNTFMKGYDLSGKKIVVFATSGGSGIGRTADKLKPYIDGAEIVDARVLKSATDAKGWAESIRDLIIG